MRRGAAIDDKKAETVSFALLENWICYHGVPKHMISDRGGEFIGKVMKLTAKALGIRQLFTTPRMPSTNGMIERLHRFIKERLRVFRSEGKLEVKPGKANWNVYLPYITYAYNSTKNRMTKQSPYAMVYGREPRDPLTLAQGVNPQTIDIPDPDPDESMTEARFIQYRRELDGRLQEARRVYANRREALADSNERLRNEARDN